jgi:hypothetical protein
MVWYIVAEDRTKILHFVENLHIIKRQFISCTFVPIDSEQSKQIGRKCTRFSIAVTMEIYVPEELQMILSPFQNHSTSTRESWVEAARWQETDHQ